MFDAPIGSDETFRTVPPEIVQEFLDNTKEVLRPDLENLHIRRRDKNKVFMRKYRYDDFDVYNIIQDLGVWNYYRTVEKIGYPAAHEFGYLDDELEIYLKISLKEVDEYYLLEVEVISFHEPSFTIQYPYANLKPQRGKKNV